MKTRAITALLAALVGISALAEESETITLHYYERPPFMVKRGDGASGLSADPAREAFEKSGVRYEWANTPAKRQLALIADNAGPNCGVGWLKNAKRETYGKFSKTIYRDKPTVVLTRNDFEPSGDTLAKLLANPNLTVVVKSGLTYGKYVIQQISTAKARINDVTVEQPVIARMIAAGRGDLMFSTQEEADMLVTSAEQESYGLKVLAFRDIPLGETRHILCSKKVSDATMDKLNAAIDRLSWIASKKK